MSRSPGQSPDRSFRFLLLAIALAAFAVRVVVGAVLNVEPGGTIRGYQFYLEMARNFSEGSGFHWRFYLGMGEKWANRPPGYPVLLVLALWTGFWPWSAVVLQSLVGAAAAVLAGLFGRRLAGPRAGLLSAGLVGFYPYFVGLDTALLEHGLFTLTVVLTALLFATTVAEPRARWAVATGLALAAGTYARISFAAVLPLVGLAFLPALGFRRGLGIAAVAGVAAAVALLPWVLRNGAVTGHAVLSSDMGRALWVGNNEWTYRHYPDESIDLSEHRAFRELPDAVRERVRALAGDEVAQSAYFREIAWAGIRERPVWFLRGMLTKLGAFFSPVLNPPTEPPRWKNWAYALGYVPALLLGPLGFFLVRRRFREWLVVPALFLGLAATAAVFWGESRHRTPLDVLLLVGVGIALARILPSGAAGRDATDATPGEIA